MKGRQTTVFTVLPVKSLDNAKSRLSPFLTVAERREFCVKMLEDVLTTVKSTKRISQTVSVDNDPEVLHTTEKLDHPFTKTLQKIATKIEHF